VEASLLTAENNFKSPGLHGRHAVEPRSIYAGKVLQSSVKTGRQQGNPSRALPNQIVTEDSRNPQ